MRRPLVPRHTDIRYSGFDQFGNRIDRTVEGFHARVVQHECDHLDGVLYPQRMRNLTAFGFVEELQQSGLLSRAASPDSAAATLERSAGYAVSSQ